MFCVKQLSSTYILWSKCITTTSIPHPQFSNIFSISSNSNNMCYRVAVPFYLQCITQDLTWNPE